MKAVLGMCNPLMDIIIATDHKKLLSLGVVPGTMNLVDYDFMLRLAELGGAFQRTPGGSGLNVIRGIAWLDSGRERLGRPLFTGSIGRDQKGADLEQLLREERVESRMTRKNLPTGVSVILVTPDSERTMFTYLGACQDYGPQDVPLSDLRTAACLHLTGYLWDTPNQEQAAQLSVEEARRSGALISFDVADPFVAHRYRDKLRFWLPGRIDVLFANRDELRSLMETDDDDDAMLAAASRLAPVVVMKVGRDGCLVRADEQILRVAGERVHAVDTTAAGDSFAAGYLYAMLMEADPQRSARLANRIASRMVTVTGCNYAALDRAEVLQALG